jgi:hypothetical protein
VTNKKNKIFQSLNELDYDQYHEILIYILEKMKAKATEADTQKINNTSGQKQHSILELDGLGKEIWQDVDVDTYIDQERKSW